MSEAAATETNEPAPAAPPPAARRWLRPAGGAALAAGTALAVAAAWLPPGLAAPSPSPRVLRILATALGAAVLLWSLYGIRMRRSIRAAGDGWVLLPAAVLLLTVLAGGAAALRLYGDGAAGFPGPADAVVVVGALIALAGTALLLADRGRSGAPRGRAGYGATAVAGVLAVAGAAWLIVPGLGVTATTAAPVPTPAVPARVSRVAWTRAMPGPVHGVVPAGPGVVALLGDGVAGVDGRTGRIRWSYRRPGAQAEQVVASADGRTALLRWRAGENGREQVVSLDAGTGRARFTADLGNPTFSYETPLTDDVWLSVPGSAWIHPEIEARSVRDDRLRWRYRIPAGCRADLALLHGTVAADTVLFPLTCRGSGGETVRLVGYRGSSRPAWQHQLTGADVTSLSVDATPDGSRFQLEIDRQRGRPARLSFDANTGHRATFRQHPLTGGRWYEPGPHGDLRLRAADGRSLGTVVTKPCADDGVGPVFGGTDDRALVGAAAAGCVTGTGGTTRVHVLGFDGRDRPVTVHLGGLYRSGPDRSGTFLVAAPGAWVAGTARPVAAGGTAELVGLR